MLMDTGQGRAINEVQAQSKQLNAVDKEKWSIWWLPILPLVKLHKHEHNELLNTNVTVRLVICTTVICQPGPGLVPAHTYNKYILLNILELDFEEKCWDPHKTHLNVKHVSWTPLNDPGCRQSAAQRHSLIKCKFSSLELGSSRWELNLGSGLQRGA